MTRLTEKHGEMYIYNYDKDCDNETREERMIETHNAIVNKLGAVEDIEQELGINLVTLFKALKNGFYAKEIHCFKNGERETIEYFNSPEIRLFDEWYIYYSCDNYHTIAYKMADYGKTWALTREELENEKKRNWII